MIDTTNFKRTKHMPKTISLMFYINPYLESLILTKQSKSKLQYFYFNPFPREAMASLRVSCVVALMCMVVITAPMAEAVISCGAVTGALVPCFAYLKGGPGPSSQCCGGVKRLNAATQTTRDRKAACKCLKGAAGSASGLNPNAAATLPAKCGVRIPYRFSTSTNCATIRF